MIFGRRYVFESKKTRAIRMALNAAVLFLLVTSVYVTFLIYTIVSARSEVARLSEGLFQKTPDAIVVFTGDTGRIKYALEMLQKWPEAKFLISGVHNSNTFSTIIGRHQDAKALMDSATQVDIDYEAVDTLGNVRETLEHLDKSPDKIQSLLVVTSDYHVFRVRMIFNHQLHNRPLTVYYDSVPSDWSKWANIKKLLVESAKTVRAWVVLNFG